MSLASISSTVQGLFGSRGRSRSHRGSLGGEEEEDVALSLAGNSSAIPATFSDSFHYSTPYRLLRFFFFSASFFVFHPTLPTVRPPLKNSLLFLSFSFLLSSHGFCSLFFFFCFHVLSHGTWMCGGPYVPHYDDFFFF